MPANGPDPAGLIACLEIRFADGESLKIISDAMWRCAKSSAPGWDKAGFDDRLWQQALFVGKYGDGPWGPIDPLTNDDVFGPQSAGISGVVRIIYVPENEPIVVKDLGRDAAYSAAYFDPVTGEKTVLGVIKADQTGSWKCPVPEFRLAGQLHDWVLILQSKT